MRTITEYPFITGLATSYFLAAGSNSVIESLSLTQARNVAIFVYALVVITLLYFGMDRDKIFNFFIGSATGLIVWFFISL